MAVLTGFGVYCPGLLSTHNAGVGGSTPPLATRFQRVTVRAVTLFSLVDYKLTTSCLHWLEPTVARRQFWPQFAIVLSLPKP